MFTVDCMMSHGNQAARSCLMCEHQSCQSIEGDAAHCSALLGWAGRGMVAVLRRGAQITFPKDLVHHGGVEHRDVHNLFGKLYHEATAAGLVGRGARDRAPDGDRAFVLSRAFYAGTQTVTTFTLESDQLPPSPPAAGGHRSSGLRDPPTLLLAPGARAPQAHVPVYQAHEVRIFDFDSSSKVHRLQRCLLSADDLGCRCSLDVQMR